ncbi:MAG TPA: glycosyltransferase family 39 protein [Isosphaeraceae bacterium]|nr:glycosyltransferase family 39 protein [Isosphaeraceae bacterium]
MLSTEPSLSIVWDEGYTLGRENRIRLWFQALRDPAGFAARWQPPRIELVEDRRTPPEAHEIDTRAKLFEPAVLSWFWPFGREEPHGHPPFYAIVGMLGDLLAPSWEVLPRARLGPMLVFSLTAGALFAFCARRLGSWPAALAAGAWVLQPRLFAHGHYATYDALLSSLWVGSILAFWCAMEPAAQPRRNPRWGWVAVFGLLAGWAADTKLTGWALPLPFLVWTAIYRDRRALLTLLVGGVVAAIVLYAFNPPWWPAPIAGIERFLHSNLSRDRTIRIPVLFLGEVIETPNGSLPWYNTLVWTVFVTPLGFLLLAIVGAARAVRHLQSRTFEVLAVLNWFFLLALRALPHTPGHDGERQFLPVFGCLALVAGLGASAVMERWPRWGRGLLAAALAEAGLGVALMMPVPLSYYSPQVGGLAGASALGMEPTYYWDAFSPEALDWLNAHTPPGDKVRFATNPSSWLYLRQTGRLLPGFLPGPGRWAWYVLQNRPGAFSATDRALIAQGKAAFVVSKWGVPLVWIFPFAQLEAVSAATLRREGPRP